MKFAKLGIILFFSCNIVLAGHFGKNFSSSQGGTPGSQTAVQFKSNFPDMEGRTKDLIAKIYALLIPTESKKEAKLVSLYPGKLYRVGGYRLHMFCSGTSKAGTPTILFESGAGGSSVDWIPIQLELSKRTQVCAYDRAGYGWSDKWVALKNIPSVDEVLPRSIDHHVEALEQLLRQAKVSGFWIWKHPG